MRKCFVTFVRHDELHLCIGAINGILGRVLTAAWSDHAGSSLGWIFAGGYVVVYEATEEADWLRKT